MQAHHVLLLLALCPACGAPAKDAPDPQGPPDVDSAGTDAGCEPWYTDADGDRYGDPATASCDRVAGAERDGTDCDDGEAAANPGATEVCDEVDNDCDGLVDDADSSLDRSMAVEVCDEVDNDCDGLVDDADPSLDLSTAEEEYAVDGDGDGFSGTAPACVIPEGADPSPADAADCDDTNPDIHPGAPEVCGNGVDEDCDDAGIGCGLATSAAEADIVYPGKGTDGAGSFVSFGDINGDGDADLAIGAYYCDSGGYASGEVRIHTTNDTGVVDPRSAWVAIPGNGPYASLGWVGAFVGDPNGDGMDDLVATASSYSVQVALYSGSTEPPPPSTWSTGDFHDCGSDVAGGWDLDGNATDDFVFGCPREDDAGAMYLVDGGETLEIAHSEQYAGFGAQLAVADFNGDGQGDVVGSAHGMDTVLLFEGPLAAGSATDLFDASATGEEDFGQELDAVGDVDDDGYDDFVAAGETGYAWLYRGSTGGISGDSFSLDVYMRSAVGGDFDADGDKDLAVGCCGSVFVAFGPVAAAPSWQMIEGGAEGIGGSLAAGDLDDDGIDDLAVGATNSVYVFFGGSL